MKFIPENVVAAGYMSGMIRLFDVKKATLLAEICAHARAVACMDVTTMPISGPFYVSKYLFNRLGGRAVTRSTLDRKVWSNLTQCCQRCDISSKAVSPGRNNAEMGPVDWLHATTESVPSLWGARVGRALP